MRKPVDGLKVRQAGVGSSVRTYRGKPHLVAADERALVAFDGRDREVGYLLYGLCAPGEGPRDWYRTSYVFVYSAFVEPVHRRRGVFGRMSRRLVRLHPGVPIVGMSVDPTGTVQRFFDRCLRMPDRRPVEQI